LKDLIDNYTIKELDFPSGRSRVLNIKIRRDELFNYIYETNLYKCVSSRELMRNCFNRMQSNFYDSLSDDGVNSLFVALEFDGRVGYCKEKIGKILDTLVEVIDIIVNDISKPLPDMDNILYWWALSKGSLFWRGGSSDEHNKTKKSRTVSSQKTRKAVPAI
jgi:hypothetical protein